MIDIGRLCLETTRKCQLQCEHCLRGNAQRKSISLEVLEATFKDIGSVYDGVTFAGGETFADTLAFNRTADFLIDKIMNSGINISSAYIVTNGLNVTNEAILKMVELFMLTDCQEEGAGGVTVSRDKYHDEAITYSNYGWSKGNEIVENARKKLSMLSFYRPYDKVWGQYKKNPEPTYIQDKYLIKQGRCKIGEREPYYEETLKRETRYEGNLSYNDAEVYITVSGDVVIGCDWSYKNMKKRKIGNVLEKPLADILYENSVEE